MPEAELVYSARDMDALTRWRSASVSARFEPMFAGQFQPDRDVADMFRAFRQALVKRQLYVSMIRVCDVPVRVVLELPDMRQASVPAAMGLLRRFVEKFIPLEWDYLEIHDVRWLCLSQVVSDDWA